MCNKRQRAAQAAKRGYGIIALLWCCTAGFTVRAQHVRDTVAVIRDFNDVMAFAVQPYVYYTSTTSMMTGPMRGGRDSVMTLHGKFYKCGDDLYYGTEAEELFVQDSLMIQIDYKRKAISIRRIDMATKKNIDLLPLKSKNVQKELRGRYVVGETTEGGDTAVIRIQTQPGMLLNQWRGAEMRVEFVKNTHLPLMMELAMRIRQDGSPENIDMLKQRGFDVDRMREELRGHPVLVVNQTTAVRFDQLSTSRDQAKQMPLWTERIVYDRVSGFTGTGLCTGYEVTKTF